jgi:hypothetical protein
MSRRTLLLLPAVIAAVALPASAAMAGEDDPVMPPPAPAPEPGLVAGSASLHATDGCVSRARARVTVTGELIDSVAFFVDGERVKTVSEADASGRYKLTMACSHLSVGAHRGKAVVSFEQGVPETLRFQITRAKRQAPRFAG